MNSGVGNGESEAVGVLSTVSTALGKGAEAIPEDTEHGLLGKLTAIKFGVSSVCTQ